MPFKFLLHSFFATGHVLPMQAVAKALIDRGHEVVWLTNSTQESRVLASGARFFATQETALVDDALLHTTASDLPAAAEALFGGRVLAQVADLRRVLKDFPADCLLNDALPQGAAAVYDLGEVPIYATLGVVPMYLPCREGSESSEDMDGEYQPSSMLGMLMTRPQLILPCINSQRAQLGLRPLRISDSLHYSPFLHMQASCPSLEFQTSINSQKTIENLHYVGPLVTATKGTSSYPSWWTDIVSSSCVIGITQGTYAVDPSSLIIPAISALSKDTNLLLVVPSPHIDHIKGKIQIPENVRLAEWVPYDLLLPKCNILITNGGYGSVTQALSHGVPIISAGTTEDKKDTAARVVWVGAGIDLGTDRPNEEQIRGAVMEILGDGKYKENALRVATELSCIGGCRGSLHLA